MELNDKFENFSKIKKNQWLRLKDLKVFIDQDYFDKDQRN